MEGPRPPPSHARGGALGEASGGTQHRAGGVLDGAGTLPGLAVPWTGPDPEEAAQLARLGVDLLCTDAVARLDATVRSSA